jgi:hypothetical protein
MSQAKHLNKPPKQKVNPKGKYNEKVWIKSGKRDFLSIDEINGAIYNNMDISSIYDRTDNMYKRTKPPKPGAGRIGNKRNNEQEQ